MAYKPNPRRSPYGARLRQLRNEAGLNLEDLAQVIGCTIVHMSSIERGERSPPDDRKTWKLLKRMGKEDLFEDFVILAAKSRKRVEISLKDKPTKVTNILVALARGCDEGELDNHDFEQIRAIVERRRRKRK